MSVQLTHKLRNPKDLSQWLDIWTADVTENNIVPGEYTYTINPSQNWKIPVTNLDLTNNTGDSTKFLNQKGDWVDVGYNLIVSTEKMWEADSQPTSMLVLKQNNNKISKIGIDTNSLNISTSVKTKEVTAQDNSTTTESWPFLDINVPSNSINTAGIVSAPTNSKSFNIWGTDNNGNPNWQKLTGDYFQDDSISGDKFNTKLLGTIISEKEPKLESDTSTSMFTRFYSKRFTGSFINSESSEIEGTGWAYYDQIYDRINKTLTIYLTNLRFRSNNNSDYYIWSASSSGNISKTYNNFNEVEGIISFSSFLDYYINEYLENYLNGENLFDDFKALTEESNKFGRYKFGNELLDEYEKYYNNEKSLPENVDIVSWEDEFNASYVVNEWDYNHCGIWIET